MGKLNVRRLGYALGAQIEGVDLSKPLDDATTAEIRQAWLDHIVLCFPGQRIEADQLRAFCARFGELDDNHGSLNRYPDQPHVLALTNKPIQISGKTVGGYGRADNWHSDHSYTVRPTTGSFLSAKVLPDVGGETMWTNMYTAYETLSPAFQRIVDGLESMHDIRMSAGYPRRGPEDQAKLLRLNPPVVHPVVRVHPETGRKALYIGDRVRKFVGMSEEESKPMRDYLIRHAIRYEFIYRHRWTADDLLMWDNRCSMHFAVQDYDQAQLRRMMRCALVGPVTGRLHSEDDEGAPLAVAAAR